jgi:hypothetical protein
MDLLKIENRIFEFVFAKLLARLIKKDFDPNRYRYFKNELGIKDWGITDSKYFQKKIHAKNNLMASESDLFELKAFDFYSGNVARQINNVLRRKISISGLEYLNEHIYQLENTLYKFKVRENIVTIRRMSCLFIDNRFDKGKKIVEKCFLSTSLNLSSRVDIDGDKTLLNNEALLIIKIPEGVHAAYIEEAIDENRQRKEYELLLQKDLTLHVELNLKIFSNRIILLHVSKN